MAVGRRVVLLLVSLIASACQSDHRGLIAKVDGEPISVSDFERVAGKELVRQREALYRWEQQKLDEYIGAFLLTKEAQRRGVSTATLLEQEVSSKIAEITDDEVKAFYDVQKARLSGEMEGLSEQIRGYLREEKLQSQRIAYFKSLRSNAKVVSYLTSPPVFRAKISVSGAATRGGSAAQVTIVKYEDFQCPFCKQGQAVLNQILERYQGKVRLVHKDLPLDSLHPQSRQAAEAARCAGDQGKFWEYHDELYASSPQAAPDDLKLYAKKVGLNQLSFEKCLTSGKHKAAVQRDVNEGAALGLTGTPTLFINGREMSGAQPVESIARLIDEELVLAK